MGKLIALRPVLYQGRMYEEGETLPAYDTRMVEAWLEAGSAEMDSPKDSDETTTGEDQEDQQKPEKDPGQGTTGAENDAELDRDTENLNATEGEQPVVDGYLDPKQLAAMKKDALEKLAEQLSVDISAAKNNAERAALISAMTVQAPVNENGGAL